MGQQWERSLFCQFQLLGSYWKVHWLKLAPGLKKVQWGKPTPPNIFFRPILPNFEKKLKSETMILGGGPCSQSVRRSDWWWSSVHTLIVPRWSPRGPKAVVKCSQMVPFGPNVFAPCFQIGPWIPKVAPKRFWATEQRPGDPKIVPGASYPQGIVAWSVLGQDGFKRSFCVVLKY